MLAAVGLVALGLALAFSPAALASGGRHGGAKKVTCKSPGSLPGYFEVADGSEVTAKRADCKTAKRVVKRFAGNCFKAYSAQARCKVKAPKRWRCRSRIVGRPGQGIPARQKCERRKSRVVFVLAYFPPTEPDIGAPSKRAAPTPLSGPFDENFKCIDLKPTGTVIPPPNPRSLGNFEIHVLRGPVSVGEDLQAALVAQRVSQKLTAGLGAQPLSNPDRVPIFVTDRRFDPGNSYGVHAPTCQYPSEDAIVVRTNLGSNDPSLATTGAHELFHAHSSGVAGGFFRPWWEEASAAWSEGRLGFSEAARWNPWLQFPNIALDYQSADPNSPDDGHQYAMWRFVQFLDVHGLIGDSTWPLQREVIRGYPTVGATFGLSEAITKANSSTSLGAQLAAFWGDRLKEQPLRGPTLKPVPANSQSIEIEPGGTVVPPPVDRLQTKLFDFKLSNQVARVEFEFDTPADGYFWGLVEKNDSRRFRKDDSVAFCVGGPGPDGELEWPGHFPVTFTNGSLSTGNIQGKITVHAQGDAAQCAGPTPDNRACQLLADGGVSGLLGPGSFPFFTQDRDEERAFWNCFYTGDQAEVNLLLQRALRLSSREVRRGVRRQIEALELQRVDGVGDIAGFGVKNDGEKNYGILAMAVGKENALMIIGPGGQRSNAITLGKRIAKQID
jgi:hypothetical protein